MRGNERAWVLGFAAVVWVAGCGSSGPRPIDKGSGGGPGGVGGSGGANAGAGGANTGAGGANTGAGGVADGGADVEPGAADGGAGGAGGAPCTGPGGLCTDFPADPIVDPGVSTDLCAAPTGPGPCIVEPQSGTLFPNNWLRPRVNVQGISGPMKITFHSGREAHDLVVYSTTSTWTMPKDIWTGLAAHVQDAPITVSVCAASGGQSTSTFTIAPAGATGDVVFFAGNPTFADVDEHACQTTLTADCVSATQLRRFSVGDETTVQTLGIDQVRLRSRMDSGLPAPVTCIGCHSATPDPGFVTFVDSYPWGASIASIQGLGAANPTGAAWPALTSSGLAALQQPGWGPMSFSRGQASSPYWQPGMRIGIGALGLKNPLVPDYSNGPDQNDSPSLAWFNLEAPPRTPQPGDNANWPYASFTPGGSTIESGDSLGFIPHVGDMCGSTPCGAAMPVWSHDGAKIVYVSTNAAMSGRLNQEVPNPGPIGGGQAYSNSQRAPGMTNLFAVPFNLGRGGAATPIDGAASTAVEEYYPDLSPDDALVAFTHVPAGEPMYLNSHAEISVVPGAGGSAVRLAANDPPACSGRSSPGVNNHWARFAPGPVRGGRGIYYWLVFSSTRANLPPAMSSRGRTIQVSQLYLAPIMIDDQFNLTTYPAIYLWNQPSNSVNTIPEWETAAAP